jgi:hypothetical protein
MLDSVLMFYSSFADNYSQTGDNFCGPSLACIWSKRPSSMKIW